MTLLPDGDIAKSVKSGSNTLEAKPFRLANPKIVVVEYSRKSKTLTSSD